MMSCTNQSGTYTYKSKFAYTIQLPKNWEEYEDEKNTDAFFNTTEWTGNLRLTPIKIDQNKSAELLKNEAESLNGKAELFTTKSGFNGLKYIEVSGVDYIYYWYVFAKDKMFICSFTIDTNQKDSNKNKGELLLVSGIINSLKL
jgi:hypothetical protein